MQWNCHTFYPLFVIHTDTLEIQALSLYLSSSFPVRIPQKLIQNKKFATLPTNLDQDHIHIKTQIGPKQVFFKDFVPPTPTLLQWSSSLGMTITYNAEGRGTYRVCTCSMNSQESSSRRLTWLWLKLRVRRERRPYNHLLSTTRMLFQSKYLEEETKNHSALVHVLTYLLQVHT